MTPETVRAPRALKHPIIAEVAARDIKKHLTAPEDHQLWRWERIALEPRA